ncbi:MAG: hypothetical protein EXQ85_09855 [Alphaproteobacteria bacterium]|nr:hypothetical protein [Alphaproteobacteria bacterium]
MSVRPQHFVFALALLVVGVSACATALAGDVRNGQVVAGQLCGLCHQMPATTDPRSGVAPPLTVLAAERVRSTDGLRRYLRGQNHPFGGSLLSDQQIDDVATYVLTLRP